MKNLLRYHSDKILILLVIFTLQGCHKDIQDQNENTISGVGWAVGLMNNNEITILHTENGGRDWTSQTQLCAGFTDFQGISAVNDEVAWAVGGKANGYGVIIRTKDKGEGWCRVGKSEDIPDVVLYGIKALSDTEAWITGENSTVLHTTDGGASWHKPVFSNLPPTIFYSVAVDASRVWLCGSTGETGVIMFSTDGGVTWTRQGQEAVEGCVRDIHVLGNETLLMAAKDKVFISNNAGLSWRCVCSSETEIRDVCAVSENNLWMISSDNILHRSSDQGTNWSDVILPVQEGVISGITAVRNGVMAVVGQKKDKSSLILISDDFGKTWKECNTPGNAMLTRASFVSGLN